MGRLERDFRQNLLNKNDYKVYKNVDFLILKNSLIKILYGLNPSNTNERLERPPREFF